MTFREPEFGRLAKVCPHCGAREVTLGSSCPACGRPYEPQGLVDRAPLVGDDIPVVGPGGGLAVAAIGLVNLGLIVLTALVRAPALAIRWLRGRLTEARREER